MLSEHRPIPGSWNRSHYSRGCKSFRLREREQQCSKNAACANKRSCSSTLKNQAVRSDVVRGVITEAVQALGYRLPTREQLLVTEQFVSGRDVFVSLPTGSGKSVCYGCLPLDGPASKKSVAGGTVCACVRAHKGRTGIRNETAYWSHDNHALRHSMFAQKYQETLRNRKRPDSLFGRVHVRVWDRDYPSPSPRPSGPARAAQLTL